MSTFTLIQGTDATARKRAVRERVKDQQVLVINFGDTELDIDNGITTGDITADRSKKTVPALTLRSRSFLQTHQDQKLILFLGIDEAISEFGAQAIGTYLNVLKGSAESFDMVATAGSDSEHGVQPLLDSYFDDITQV